jgi:hypothetical protein
MRARLDEAGGACVVESWPGAGRCVRFTLPLPGEEGTRQKPDSPVSGMVKEPAHGQSDGVANEV